MRFSLTKIPASFCAIKEAYQIGPFLLGPPDSKSGYRGFDVPDTHDRRVGVVTLHFTLERDFTYLDLCNLRDAFGSDLINISPGEAGYYGDFEHAYVKVKCSWQKVLPLLHTAEETEELIKADAAEKEYEEKRQAYRAAKAAGLKVEDPDGDTPEKPFNPNLYPAAPRK